MVRCTRLWKLLIITLLAGAVAAAAPAQSKRLKLREQIGYFDAYERLGEAMPTGQGVAFGHVEGQSGAYAPDLDGAAFDSVAFSLRSGPSEPSAHAAATARLIYGKAGLAPGVEVVHAMTSQDFLTSALLRVNSTAPPVLDGQAPTAMPPRVYTNSWIGDPEDAVSRPILRRLDFVINHRDLIIVAGVNNGRDSSVPALLASSYNAIAVGTSSGKSSGGYTTIEKPGRCKPDLVVPNGLTSFTTPVVSACAAILLEMADRLVEAGHSAATRAEVIKAVLLAGCTKPQGWAPAPGKPLDEHLGAGQVNINRSLRILESGEQALGRLRSGYGWSFASPRPGETEVFEIELSGDTGPFSVIATWNRRIDGRVAVITDNDSGQRKGVWLDGPRLANFDLRLVRIDGEDPEAETTVLAKSASEIDNVEHLYLPALEAGRYRLELIRREDGLEESYDVALAWALDPPPEAPAETPAEAPAQAPG